MDVEPKKTSAYVRWKPPVSQNGVKYFVARAVEGQWGRSGEAREAREARAQSGDPSCSGGLEDTGCTIKGLSSDTGYVVTVQACDASDSCSVELSKSINTLSEGERGHECAVCLCSIG